MDKGCHSVYFMRFHYVCCVKYRRKVLSPEVTKYLKEVNENIAGNHIHIIFASKPAVQLSKFINSLKSTSARLIFRDHPEVKKQLWGGSFWSPSYFLFTVGEVKLEDVKKYVQSQGNT